MGKGKALSKSSITIHGSKISATFYLIIEAAFGTYGSERVKNYILLDIVYCKVVILT